MSGDTAGRGFRALGEESVYAGHAIDVKVGTFEGPDASTFTRDIVRHRGAVAVVPLHDDGTVTLVRQYRAPIDDLVLEIPAGIRDVDEEDLEATAARELREEVGLEADGYELLCTFHNAVGSSDELTHVYLSTGLHAVDDDLQGVEEEHMVVERHPLDELVDMIHTGALTDAKSVIGVALVALRGAG